MIYKILCYLGKCWRCETNSDDNAVWGECIDCHKKHGVTSRKSIRRYLELEALGKLNG
jgi:hypothetical protein